MIGDPASLVIVEGATPDEREAVHQLVVKHSDGWWHWFGDVWIVGGLDVFKWSDLLANAIESEGKLFVLALPDHSRRSWAIRGVGDDAVEWLKTEFRE